MKTQTYSKINTLYKRYINLKRIALPNKAWLAFQNRIILGDYSDDFVGYIKDLPFDCFSKIDGTNAKIVYLPSTGECFCGGKTDDANIDGNGLKAYLDEVIARIKPQLAEMFPRESARFIPEQDDRKQNIYTYLPFTDNLNDRIVDTTPNLSLKTGDLRVVEMVEVPVYIYGEFFGKKIGPGGNYDRDGHRFYVFDICQQGWYVPVEILREYTLKLGLTLVPYLGRMTIPEAEQMVMKGFKTHVPDASNPDYPEEGIVLRPTVPIKDPRGNRIIVKVKSKDYTELKETVDRLGKEEYLNFHSWYLANRDTIENA